MQIPNRALPTVHRLLTWSQIAGLVLVPTDAGTVEVVGDLHVPTGVQRAIDEVGPVVAAALTELEIPAPVVSQTVLWWEVAAQQMTPEARALLPMATQARRRRLVALRAVHLAALTDVIVPTTFPPSA